MSSVILYSTFASSRLNYVLDYVFEEVLGIGYVLTHDEQEFQESDFFRINYSHRTLQCDLHFDSMGLLDEVDIVEKEITISYWNKLPIFFQCSDKTIPFDLFSAVFYLITRYEEYLPYEPDEFIRFPHTHSLAYEYDFLKIPLVDLWLKEFKQQIIHLQPSLVFQDKSFAFIPTYDIDIAYSYLGKGWVRTLGGVVNDIQKGAMDLVTKRIRVLRKKENDPYDTYALLDSLHQTYNLHPIYFFLLSRGGTMDKNIDREHPLMKTLIEKLTSKHAIGIHPSWQSHDDISLLQEELDQLVGTKLSRQHYIRFTLPETYRNLIKLGIKEDYSMGYGSINGFRASTSHPYFWFDLEKNTITSLRLFPFCFMECNSFFEQKLTTEQAYEELVYYANEVKYVHGTLITIWHNFSLGSDPLWKGWSDVYKRFLVYLNT